MKFEILREEPKADENQKKKYLLKPIGIKFEREGKHCEIYSDSE